METALQTANTGLAQMQDSEAIKQFRINVENFLLKLNQEPPVESDLPPFHASNGNFLLRYVDSVPSDPLVTPLLSKYVPSTLYTNDFPLLLMNPYL